MATNKGGNKSNNTYQGRNSAKKSASITAQSASSILSLLQSNQLVSDDVSKSSKDLEETQAKQLDILKQQKFVSEEIAAAAEKELKFNQELLRLKQANLLNGKLKGIDGNTYYTPSNSDTTYNSGEVASAVSAATEKKDSPTNTTLTKIFALINKLYDRFDKYVDSSMATYTKNTAAIDTRLQGLPKDFDSTFKSLTDNLQNTLTTSSLVSMNGVVDSISKLVDQGVSYNLEYRAYLDNISDRIATTFNALDENLERLIRLQQTDLTSYQLGAEYSLTNFLNSYFQDTSYLSGTYDTVFKALVDASSQMSEDQAVGFNYTIQKWLGAMYSVGLSDTAATSIAQALASISTGNVSGLSSDKSNILIELAASAAGLPLSDLLTRGLDYRLINDLMRSLVTYVRDIPLGTSNQVLRSEWGNILGLSVSDLRAISNLTDEDINAIYSTNKAVDTSSASRQLVESYRTIKERTSIQQQLDNMVSNVLYSASMNIATDKNKLDYLAWKMGRMVAGESNSTYGQVAGALISAKTLIDDGKKLFKQISNSIDISNPYSTPQLMEMYPKELYPELYADDQLAGVEGALNARWMDDYKSGLYSDYAMSKLTKGFKIRDRLSSRGIGTDLDPITVINGVIQNATQIGLETGLSYSGYTGYAALKSLDQQAALITADAKTIVSNEAGVTSEADKFFAEQNTPVKIELDEKTAEIMLTLLDNSNESAAALQALREQNSDINNMYLSLSLARGA